MTRRMVEQALGELGQAESLGRKTNPRIAAYHTVLGALPPGTEDPDDVPWCSAFAAYCVAQTQYNKPPAYVTRLARSWTGYGRQVPALTLFSIVVLWRGDPTGWQGHVGFCVGSLTLGQEQHVLLLGGNQGGKGGCVSIAPYPMSHVLDWRDA